MYYKNNAQSATSINNPRLDQSNAQDPYVPNTLLSSHKHTSTIPSASSPPKCSPAPTAISE